MPLTLKNRLKLCREILTTRSGHARGANEEQLSTFQRGYIAGLRDGMPKLKMDRGVFFVHNA